jgi:predicted aminopeptidase
MKVQGARRMENERRASNKSVKEHNRAMVTKSSKLSFSACACLAAVFVLGAGCRAGYVMHAAVGQIRLVSSAVPIDDALAGSDLSASQKERLALVSKIKEFGEKELGLKQTSSYQTIYLGSDQPPLYTLAAAPKDRLTLVTWWFPVVGRMPYLGFFDLEKAREQSRRLMEKDLDVVIGRADAYSTLGWFRDPLTLNLIHGSEPDLVETIFHEMTHTTLYLKGQGALNEGLAQIIGKRGALQFLEKTRGPSHPLTLEAKANLEDERLFASFLATVFEELEQVYRSSLSLEEKLVKREALFLHTLEAFEVLKDRLKTQKFAHFGRIPLNNAYIMALSLYHRNYPLFEAVLERHGDSIREMLSFFQDLSRKEGDLLAAAGKWLRE